MPWPQKISNQKRYMAAASAHNESMKITGCKLRTALVPLTEPLRIENGLAVVSAEPGSGIEFNDAAVEKYLA
jgi:L-alanine-DL-glutamate epimerase-like enolase superfamily enzyme